MLKYIYDDGNYDLNLTSGEKYIITKSRAGKLNFTLEEN